MPTMPASGWIYRDSNLVKKSLLADMAKRRGA